MSRLPALAALVALLAVVVACGTAETGRPAATKTSTTSSTPSTLSTPTTTTGPTTSTPSPAPPTTHTTTPQVRWPTHDVSRPFRGAVPPVPTVTAIRIGTHPEGGYDRIAVELDAQTGYQAGYRPTVVRDGSGLPVQLNGRAFLQVVLTPAQAHDDAGRTTTPTNPVTVYYPSLKAYVVNGDFEGYVSIALGLAGKDGFRVGTYRMANGHQVVYVDVRQP
ncbi:hypothetical protein [Actinophytocola sp. NPDC049390]|uniref:AMIN-like domain-containing (lipo)protein n=1 Tax=Actinophytocola sp. NPDC049390 TaxID=3363894 RepID=UPI0037B7E857